MDEKLMKQSNQQQLFQAMNKSRMPLSDLNDMSIPQGIDNESQMPVFINQARLANFYQNNPAPVLQYSQRFGLPPMGGPVNMQQVPGSYVRGISEYVDYAPTQALANSVLPPSVYSSSQPTGVAGMNVPGNMAQNFYQKTRQ